MNHYRERRTVVRFGKIEIDILKSLVKHGIWYRRCGWLWDTHSGTERRLKRLAEKGAVQVTLPGPVYAINAKGRRIAGVKDGAQ